MCEETPRNLKNGTRRFASVARMQFPPASMSAYGSYVIAALLQSAGIDLIARLNACRY